MAEQRPTRPVSLRLRPSEHRTLLFIGDLIASVLAAVGANYTWLGYAWYRLISTGISPMQAVKFFPSADVPFWFYFLPAGNRFSFSCQTKVPYQSCCTK